MNERFECGEYLIEQVECEKEFNYIVTKNGEYICRLVPGHNRFELSPLDKAVGTVVEETLVGKLGNRILDYYD